MYCTYLQRLDELLHMSYSTCTVQYIDGCGEEPLLHRHNVVLGWGQIHDKLLHRQSCLSCSLPSTWWCRRLMPPLCCKMEMQDTPMDLGLFSR